MMFIDSHAHLGDYTEEEIQNILNSETSKVISIGCTYDEIIKSYDLATKYKNKIFSTAGVYPHNNKEENAGKTDNELIQQVKDFSHKDGIVAIGECGFDFSDPSSPEIKRDKDAQYKIFYEQVVIAKESQKPIIIHSRQAKNETLDFLHKHKDDLYKTIWHCFTEDLAAAKVALDLGVKLSFTGIITYKSGVSLRETIKYIGLENLMIETDSPFLTPDPLRNSGIKKNSPINVKIIAENIADITGLSLMEVAEITTNNAVKFFNLTND